MENLREQCPDLTKIYVEIFENVDVRLDSFHAMQRVVHTIPKGTVISVNFGKEFGLVFREEGDLGHVRQKSTPDPEKLDKMTNCHQKLPTN